MKIVALSVKDAETFLKAHERHYKAPVEAICAIGVADDDYSPTAIEVTDIGSTEKRFIPNGKIHGAAILGRRADGDAELAHIYCDGSSQGYSLLYGSCWRALKALGYERAVL